MDSGKRTCVRSTDKLRFNGFEVQELRYLEIYLRSMTLERVNEAHRIPTVSCKIIQASRVFLTINREGRNYHHGFNYTPHNARSHDVSTIQTTSFRRTKSKSSL